MMGIPNKAEGLDISLREGGKLVFREEILKVSKMMLERGSRPTSPDDSLEIPSKAAENFLVQSLKSVLSYQRSKGKGETVPSLPLPT